MSTTLGPALAAEWTKIRTVRSTPWTLGLLFVLSLGMGALIAGSFRGNVDQWENFTPLVPGLYGLTVGQLALVVFAALIVGSEYGSGTIRSSLAAVPRRGLLFSAKVLVGTGAAAGVSVVTVFAGFLLAQRMLGPYGTTLGADGVLPAVLGACLYLTLICVIVIGVTTVLRSSTLALGIMTPVLFLNSQGLANVPKLRTVLQFLPDQAGMELMRIASGPQDDGRFGPEYGPWGALVVLLGWTVAALIGGYLALERRDA